MRATLTLLLLLAAAAPALAQRSIDERFAAAPGSYVRIQNYVGSVRVTGWPKDSLVVSGTFAKSDADQFAVHVGMGGAKVGFFEPDGAQQPSHLEVFVPSGSQLWIKTAGADVYVSGVSGGVDVYSVSGRIEITGDPAEVFAESMAGAIVIAADTRTVRAKSAGGDITVRGTVADVIATTVSGNLIADGTGLTRGRFESVDGGIRYSGAIPRGGWLDFINHSGSVELLIPRDASAEFEVTTFEGGFDDRIGVRTTRVGNKLNGERLTFTIGQGGAHVSVRNFKGTTVLRRK